MSTSLSALQQWMQDVIVDPRPTAQVESGARRYADAAIRPSATLAPLERVMIHRDMYLLRMEEALAADFSALRHFLGEERFFSLVKAYVERHPSRGHSLNRLSDALPAFLAEYRPLPRAAFCRDLARLELAITQTIDAPPSPVLASTALEAISVEDWDRVRVTPIRAMQLLTLTYPADEYLEAVEDAEEPPSAPRKRDSWVVVFRPGYTMRRQRLERKQAALLESLVAGTPLFEAFASLATGRGPVEWDRLILWFRGWLVDGMFSRLLVASEEPSVAALPPAHRMQHP